MDQSTKTSAQSSNGGNFKAETPADATSKLLRGVDTAGAALHTGIDKVADPAKEAIEKASSAAHGGVDRLASGATHAADRFSAQTQRIAEAPQRALDYSKSRVQDKPLQAVAAALALGFIIGRLTGR